MNIPTPEEFAKDQGYNPFPRRWDRWLSAVREGILSAQPQAGRNVSTDEHPGKGTVINVARRPGPAMPTAGTGACCIGEECSITTEAACTDAGGIYHGDDTDCEPNPCLCVISSIRAQGSITGAFCDDTYGCTFDTTWVGDVNFDSTTLCTGGTIHTVHGFAGGCDTFATIISYDVDVTLTTSLVTSASTMSTACGPVFVNQSSPFTGLGTYFFSEFTAGGLSWDWTIDIT
jgi:hypothetical protein